ncbi:helix-turn-helix domain-containing protein [Mesorhizobium sp. C395A]|uniref:helix-turn-helix domain-containing protein n=1 Tax=Mesorhizobium sp. C395A TaxID=2956832 RepID=UPI00336ADE7A
MQGARVLRCGERDGASERTEGALERWRQAPRARQEGKPVSTVARLLGVHRSTLYRALQD